MDTKFKAAVVAWIIAVWVPAIYAGLNTQVVLFASGVSICALHLAFVVWATGRKDKETDL